MIKTERLELHVLDVNELELWINDIPKLEKDLKIKYKAEPMEGIFKEIVNSQLKITQMDEENYIWHSFWFLIRKSDRVVVGSADFKDKPNQNSEVEIGYGLGKEFEHKGYMTETVKAMCKWALSQKGVSHVIAETDIDGYKSQKILEKCGFIEESRNETIWWKL